MNQNIALVIIIYLFIAISKQWLIYPPSPENRVFTDKISNGISACNRTLYGDVGRTYEVEVRRPREDRLPFICHLNFTAANGDFGDLVQVKIYNLFINIIIILSS